MKPGPMNSPRRAITGPAASQASRRRHRRQGIWNVSVTACTASSHAAARPADGAPDVHAARRCRPIICQARVRWQNAPRSSRAAARPRWRCPGAHESPSSTRATQTDQRARAGAIPLADPPRPSVGAAARVALYRSFWEARYQARQLRTVRRAPGSEARGLPARLQGAGARPCLRPLLAGVGRHGGEGDQRVSPELHGPPAPRNAAESVR